jgi:hypothetical protein
LSACRANRVPQKPGNDVEAHLREHAVHVHVADPRVDVEGAGAELIEGGGLHPVFLGRAPHHGVQADVRDLGALEDPDVGAVLLAHHARRARLPLRREVLLEHAGRLDHVVVDADQDESFGLHGGSIEI